jgi:hypothetical protein
MIPLATIATVLKIMPMSCVNFIKITLSLNGSRIVGMLNRRDIYWFMAKLVMGLIFSTMLVLCVAYLIAGWVGVSLVFGFGSGFYLGYAGKCWGVTFHKGGE